MVQPFSCRDEITVTLGRRARRGGHNTEFLLSLALALKGHDGIWGFSGDTDGMTAPWMQPAP